MKSLYLLALLSLAACSDRASTPTSPSLPKAPSFLLYDPSRPAPQNVSAALVGSGLDGDTISLTFTDTAEGEAYVSAYFPPTATLAAATANLIDGTADASGERTVTVVVQAGHTSVMLRNLWTDDIHDPNQNVWGPFSAAADVSGSVAITTLSTKGKGKK